MDNEMIHKIASYIQGTGNVIDELLKERDVLREKLASARKQSSMPVTQPTVMPTGMTKEAAVALANVVIEAGFIDKVAKQSFIDGAVSNPNGVSSFLRNLANITIETKGLPSLGSVHKEASVTASKGKRQSDISYEASMDKLASKLRRRS